MSSVGNLNVALPAKFVDIFLSFASVRSIYRTRSGPTYGFQLVGMVDKFLLEKEAIGWKIVRAYIDCHDLAELRQPIQCRFGLTYDLTHGAP